MILVRIGNTQRQNSSRFASAQCACRGDGWCVSLSLSLLILQAVGYWRDVRELVAQLSRVWFQIY